MHLPDHSSDRLALPNETPPKRWQIVLAIAFALLLLGGIVALTLWGIRRSRSAGSSPQAIRPTYAAGQTLQFAMPASIGAFATEQVKVRNTKGEAIQAVQVEIGGEANAPSVKVVNPESLKPGTYTIEIMQNDKRIFAQDFSAASRKSN